MRGAERGWVFGTVISEPFGSRHLVERLFQGILVASLKLAGRLHIPRSNSNEFRYPTRMVMNSRFASSSLGTLAISACRRNQSPNEVPIQIRRHRDIHSTADEPAEFNAGDPPRRNAWTTARTRGCASVMRACHPREPTLTERPGLTSPGKPSEEVLYISRTLFR